jgi:hypothetical protein
MSEFRIAPDGNSIGLRTAMRHINHRTRAPVEADAPLGRCPHPESRIVIEVTSDLGFEYCPECDRKLVETLQRRGTECAEASVELLVFPAHAVLIVEERLREQQREDVRMPAGIPLDELALRVLIAAETGLVPR